MESEEDTEIVQVRRLPTLHFEGEGYFIDNQLDEFRTITPPVRLIEFVRFESEKGLRMLDECVWQDCAKCGRMMAVSKQSTESVIRCSGCSERFQLANSVNQRR